MGHIFFELTIIICLAAVLVVIFRLLKQPLILAYILAGIIIGPLGIFPIGGEDMLRTMGELGITLLLFILGLELRFSELRSIGKVALLLGFVQMLGTFLIGYAFALLLGYTSLTGIYIGLALTFSSTIIVVKLLGDKKDLSSLYGKITIGVLLAQDFLAIMTLIVLSGFQNSTIPESISLYPFVWVFVKAALLFGIVYLFSRSLFPKIIDLISRSSEALFLVSLAIAFGMAALVSSPYIGFSIEIGGFLAGLALANSHANFQIVARVRALRDFFITLFFVFLGTQMMFQNVAHMIVPAVVLLSVVLLYKPLLIMTIMGFMGYRRRTSFMTALSLAQVSEFSLIVIFLGNQLGQINDTIASLVTMVAVASFVISNYCIANAQQLYKLLHTYLDVFERKHPSKENIGDVKDFKNHTILIGANRMGGSILKTFEKKGEDVIVVDFDPDVIKSIGEKEGIVSIFGDISDVEIQERAQIQNAKLIISTVADLEDNLILLQSLQKMKAKIVVVAQNTDEAKRLYAAGADYVVLPHLVGGRHIANMLKGDNIDVIDDLKNKDKLFF